MKTLTQSPRDPAFVQNPYPFYAAARAQGPLHWWADYDMPAAFGHDLVASLLRDRRFGREAPPEKVIPPQPHLTAFQAVEAHSLLDAEPPRHTRLRGLILRAFTSRTIARLAPTIAQLCDDHIAAFPETPFDLIPAYCTPVPALVIARLLGVPDSAAPDFLRWSHDMVAMYQTGVTRNVQDRANAASAAFTAFLERYIAERRSRPADDLITHLIAAEQDGARLSTEELIGTCILLLNAGHEATVHALSHAVATVLTQPLPAQALAPDAIDGTIEEVMRFSPPLHMFTRYAYEQVEIAGHTFQRGDQVALLLAAANRDPAIWPDPDRFDWTRPPRTNASFGGGLHFCVGAPLARLELSIALPRLLRACPDLALNAPVQLANTYHFHGLTQLMVTHTPPPARR